MRRRDFRENQQPLVMTIPMIDIMLFLLVFFRISTIYMVQTNSIQVSLPQAEQATQETRPRVVPITVLSTGEILFEKDTMQSENLPQRVHDTLAADTATIFLLMGDKNSKYENVVSVLDLLKKSGARHVSIATEIKH